MPPLEAPNIPGSRRREPFAPGRVVDLTLYESGIRAEHAEWQVLLRVQCVPAEPSLHSVQGSPCQPPRGPILRWERVESPNISNPTLTATHATHDSDSDTTR